MGALCIAYIQAIYCLLSCVAWFPSHNFHWTVWCSARNPSTDTNSMVALGAARDRPTRKAWIPEAQPAGRKGWLFRCACYSRSSSPKMHWWIHWWSLMIVPEALSNVIILPKVIHHWWLRFSEITRHTLWPSSDKVIEDWRSVEKGMVECSMTRPKIQATRTLFWGFEIFWLYPHMCVPRFQKDPK